jgi:sarcosine oxidase subunit alpha
MFSRSRALRDPVTITLDGEAIPAERGEPLAIALLARDKTILARSPKLHRPRGPTCLRGGCDGCLARVSGVPNVMTCLRPAEGGERIESQNVVGSRRADLLRVTDWFFAKGIDHHHLMAGVPGLSDVMQSFARKVAGLGRLPSGVEPPRPAQRIEIDAAVIGAGPAGIGVASRLARANKRVLLADDGLALGGSLAGAPNRAKAWLVDHPLTGVDIRMRSVASGDYFGDLLIATDDGALVVRPRARIFTTGAHDGVLSVPNNDLPGIFSARAFCRLLAAGLEPDGPVAIVGESGFWAEETVAALAGRPSLRLTESEVIAVHGTGGVKSIEVSAGGKTRTHKVTAIALALPGAPAFELAEQAGAAVKFDPATGYRLVADPHGRVADGVWAAGECTGALFDLPALAEASARVAESVLSALG